MMKHNLFTLLLISGLAILTGAVSSMKDDGVQQKTPSKAAADVETFKTVKIGTQIWMAENLNISHFRNGDPIPEAKTDAEWVEKTPAWCYYNNDPKNGQKYGKLYNWYALTDPRGLAPEGWHIPNGADWDKLGTFLGGISEAGTKMKSKTGWNENGNGTNESGFSGLPGSLRYEDGQFNDLGRMGFWWSTTRNIAGTLSYTLNLSNGYMGWGIGKANESYGFAVRCIKD
jgi:uncharacterized protein (TIGR02145 family)